MDKYLKKAIDILTSDNDWKKICAKIAKDDPKRFCEIVLGPEDLEQIVIEIYQENNGGSSGTLAAITYVRTNHNCSLHEAKIIVNNILNNKK